MGYGRRNGRGFVRASNAFDSWHRLELAKEFEASLTREDQAVLDCARVMYPRRMAGMTNAYIKWKFGKGRMNPVPKYFEFVETSRQIISAERARRAKDEGPHEPIYIEDVVREILYPKRQPNPGA